MALRQAATSAPGTVAQLADRACVGQSVARYTASRLVRAGELVPVGGSRPAVLAMPPQGDGLGDALVILSLSFWGDGPSTPGEPDP